GSSLLAMASDAGEIVGGSAVGGCRRSVGSLRCRMGDRLDFDIFDRSFRSVRTTAGLPLCHRPAVLAVAVPHPDPLSDRPAPDYARLPHRFLGHTSHDLGPLVVRRGYDGLHRSGDLLRGAGFEARLRRHLRGVSAAGAYIGALGRQADSSVSHEAGGMVVIRP